MRNGLLSWMTVLHGLGLVLFYSTSMVARAVSFKPYSHQIKVDFYETCYDFSMFCKPNEQERFLALETFGCSLWTTPRPIPASACEIPYLSAWLNIPLYHGLRTSNMDTDHIITSSYEVRDTKWPHLLNPQVYLDIRMSRLLSSLDACLLQS